MFDREQAIAEWKERMLAAGIEFPVPLEELEQHLRDEIEHQIESGKSEEEALRIAVEMIGQPSTLRPEFEKSGYPLAGSADSQGFINMMLCSALLVCSVAALAIVFSYVLHRSIWESVPVAYAVDLVVILTASALTWYYALKSKGDILLDCGPHRMRRLFTGKAVLFILTGAVGFFDGSLFKPTILGFTTPLLILAGIMELFIFPSGRLQVCQRGIWFYWGLIRWDKIERYSWDANSNLSFRVKGRVRLLRRGMLQVPPEHRASFDGFLQRFCAPSA